MITVSTININNVPFMDIHVSKELLDNKIEEINKILISYIWQMETPEIKLEIKNKILKLFIKDLRKLKIEKIVRSKL